MELSRDSLQGQLAQIADEGWDGDAAAVLLRDLRREVVQPVVRASSLRGAAADQAEASAWAAAWDALRRPSARAALNPGGMVWSAVRRSVLAEMRAGQAAGIPVEAVADLAPPVVGWRQSPVPDRSEEWSELEPVIGLLVAAGWARAELCDLLAVVGEVGRLTAWRRVASLAGQPAWRARRVMVLLMGDPGAGCPGLVALMVTAGREVLEHGAAGSAARSTRVQWLRGPREQLHELALTVPGECPEPPLSGPPWKR